MEFPDFFAQVPRLTVRDPLADLLGAARDGRLEYTYADAVKLAGHSCPTVAGAYLMTCRALARLYGDELPERGSIRVAFAAPADAGVTGVMGAVAGLLTGAAGEGGFQGLAGQFARRHLLGFGSGGSALATFSARGRGPAIGAQLNLQCVPADPAMGPLLQQCLAGEGGPEARQAFGRLWQDRVRRILIEHWDDPEVLSLEALA